MLLHDELCEDEFELRWHSALLARTPAELDDVRYETAHDDKPEGVPDEE